MADINEKVLKDAQYRKSLTIAFFNANNAAVELTKGYKYNDEAAHETAIARWRDWFLAEHQKYWATVINTVGSNFKAGEAVKKLQNCKTYDELGTVWRLLSEDERRDAEIIKVAKEMKAKLVPSTGEKVATEPPKVATPAPAKKPKAK